MSCQAPKHLVRQKEQHKADSQTAASRCAKWPVAMAKYGRQFGYNIHEKGCNSTHLLCKNTQLLQL